MDKGRLEAFSDGVLAIIITIMVLELKVPQSLDLDSIVPLYPKFASYVMSFVYIGIYWNNHHHMFHATRHVNGAVLWANLHLLFWLSLIPFTTSLIGENHFARVPMAVYGTNLLMCALAFYILQRNVIAEQGPSSLVAAAVGRDLKGKLSPVAYLLGIPGAFISPWIAGALYVAVALMWLVPDQRFERAIAQAERQS